MAENRMCRGSDQTPGTIREAVCIDTGRVYDSCAEKDCLADLRVHFLPKAQQIIEKATAVKCSGCEILNVLIDVEKVPFNQGCYSVDITFFFKVMLNAYIPDFCKPVPVEGLTTFSKKCILFGSEGRVHVFSSEFSADSEDPQLCPTGTNPRAKVQVVDPICLDAKLCRPNDCCDWLRKACCCKIPRCIMRCFAEEFPDDFGCCPVKKTVSVTIGIFSIVQLERDVQILIPAYDFCIPSRECACSADDPCESFRKIQFPLDEFFPPSGKCEECPPNDPDDRPCGCV